MLDALLYLVGVAGLAGSLTVLFLGMRAVMDVGGFCAEGGPYQIETHCPDGALLMPLAIFTGLGSAALMAWRGSRLGGGYGALVFLAWPALFLSLGWNFLEYGVSPPAPATGIELGWLIPGVLFVIMGGVPLLAVLPSRRLVRSSTAVDRREVDSTNVTLADGEARYAAQMRRARARLLGDLVEHADHEREVAPPQVRPGRAGDLVSELERLDALHRSGALSYDEFQRAKAALLAARE